MDDLDAILSPSKARQAASQAKDWAYVMNWLNRKYANSPNPRPKFEMNEDTLKVLLNIAAANDTADEEEALVHRAREETIDLLKAEETEPLDPKVGILEDIQEDLDDKSAKLLQDLAETSVLLGVSTADVGNLDRSLLDVGREEFDTTGQLRKLEMLQRYLERELALLRMQLEELKGDTQYETPADLPAKTSEWLRNKKVAEAKGKEYQSRFTAGGRSMEIQGPKIDELMVEEEGVVRMRERVKSLESKIKAFHGLPPSIPEARLEYTKLEKELRSLVQQRDTMFAGLISRGRS
ncbi:hypothetical protein PRK78_006096 [Emydomyces testavorans]|uniref:HAUS augmin-like complex subunit 1 n=1 Tax=Emydomyces testavorans TaxID=2070801 RepID=A0AAF0DKS8_9EURO|nr:hypothetical protein PRK78_006096 [Emydomyces testavorans]